MGRIVLLSHRSESDVRSADALGDGAAEEKRIVLLTEQSRARVRIELAPVQRLGQRTLE